ncbi:MAG: ParA family protein [Azoarcus sp.]|jgi:chromosome partitioning protein|nr:ParA family protein [Azoarcus sp.]
MKTLAVEIQKGGEGKTFVVCNLAFDAYERGLRTVVIDLDTQANASLTLSAYRSGYTAWRIFGGKANSARKWFAEHEHDGLALIEADNDLVNLEKMRFPEAARKLGEVIQSLGEFFDLCLIDTPPFFGVAMTAAALAADYVVSPVRLEPYSIQGMQRMVTVIANLRQIKHVRWLGMIPNMVRLGTPRHDAHMDELKAAFPQHVLPVSIGWRDSIAEGLGNHLPVWEVRNEAGKRKSAARTASKEVRALADHIFKAMELT